MQDSAVRQLRANTSLQTGIFVKIILKFSIVLMTAVFSGCDNQSRSGLNPGDNPPAFDLYTLEGEKFSFDKFKGKVVLLNFWATWCGPCVDELPSMQILYDKLKDRGFEIMAIGIDDDADSLREFKRKYSLTFPVFIDKSGTSKGKYKITGVPESFILDRDGKFIMFPDLSDNMPVVKIVGPRNWSTADAVSRISDLLN